MSRVIRIQNDFTSGELDPVFAHAQTLPNTKPV